MKSSPSLLAELKSAIAMLTKNISAHRLIMLPCQILAGLILCLFFSSGPAPSPSSFLPSPSPQPSQSPAAARTPQNFSVPSPGPLNTPGKWSENCTAHGDLVYVLVTVIVPRKPVIVWHNENFKEVYKAASIASKWTSHAPHNTVAWISQNQLKPLFSSLNYVMDFSNFLNLLKKKWYLMEQVL